MLTLTTPKEMAFWNSSTAEPEPPWKTKKTGFLSPLPSLAATNSWCFPSNSGWSLTLLRRGQTGAHCQGCWLIADCLPGLVDTVDVTETGSDGEVGRDGG